jgi:hypothetical protein
VTKVNRVISKGVAQRFGEAISRLQNPGDYVVVIRGVPRTIVMACPEGCGETLTVNLDRRSGPAWRKYERKGALTIFPSVWRESGCRAHFIVHNDHILWCDSYGYSEGSIDEASVAEVFKKLPQDSFISYELLAEDLQAIPWEVLWICRRLVRQGRALDNKNTFKRVGNDGGTLPIKGRLDILA